MLSPSRSLAVFLRSSSRNLAECPEDETESFIVLLPNLDIVYFSSPYGYYCNPLLCGAIILHVAP